MHIQLHAWLESVYKEFLLLLLLLGFFSNTEEGIIHILKEKRIPSLPFSSSQLPQLLPAETPGYELGLLLSTWLEFFFSKMNV